VPDELDLEDPFTAIENSDFEAEFNHIQAL